MGYERDDIIRKQMTRTMKIIKHIITISCMTEVYTPANQADRLSTDLQKGTV